MNNDKSKSVSDIYRDMQSILEKQKAVINFYNSDGLKTLRKAKGSVNQLNIASIRKSALDTYKIKPYFPELTAQIPSINSYVSSTKYFHSDSFKKSLGVINTFNSSFTNSTFESLKQSLKVATNFSSMVPSMKVLSQFNDSTLRRITINKQFFNEIDTIKRIVGNSFYAIPSVQLSFEDIFDFSETDLTEEEQSIIIENSNKILKVTKDVSSLGAAATFGVAAFLPATKKFVISTHLYIQEVIFNDFLMSWFQSEMQKLIDTATHAGMSFGFTCIIVGILLVYHGFISQDELDELEH